MEYFTYLVHCTREYIRVVRLMRFKCTHYDAYCEMSSNFEDSLTDRYGRFGTMLCRIVDSLVS